MFGKKVLLKEIGRLETLFRAAALDCSCGPSRVVIRPVYSEGSVYGWYAICSECGLKGQSSASRNNAAELWAHLIKAEENKRKDWHDPALVKKVAEVCLKK